MGDVPSILGGLFSICEGSNVGITTGSSNTKSAYSQLIASTARDYHGLIVTLNANSVASTVSYLGDLAIGGAGSERVILPNIAWGAPGTSQQLCTSFFVPIFIPKGSRIAYRAQSSSGSQNITVRLWGFTSKVHVPNALSGLATNYGVNTSTSLGTTMTSGTAGVKGSYAEIISSTTSEINFLIIQMQNSNLSGVDDLDVDIAVGGAGSEQIILPSLHCNRSTTTGQLTPMYYAIPISVPAGTRLAARCAFGANATKTCNIAIMGVS